MTHAGIYPGDLVFAHSTGSIAKAIRFGEALRGDKNESKWNHAAIIDRPHPTSGDWYVIQAEARGVTNFRLLSEIAPGGKTQVRPCPPELNPEDVLEFARSQVGAKYGFLTIVSCILDVILPRSICLRRSMTWICSGLVTAALMFAGWVPAQDFATDDLYSTTPAQLAEEVAP